MPQLVFKGVKREDVIHLSKKLPNILSELTDTPVDYFTFERPNTEYFSLGESFEMYPLVEIIQFDRGKFIERQIAKAVQDEIKKLNYDECEVYFTHITKENYYE